MKLINQENGVYSLGLQNEELERKSLKSPSYGSFSTILQTIWLIITTQIFPGTTFRVLCLWVSDRSFSHLTFACF